MKKVGRVGGKALIYFEIVSTFALIIGLLVVNIVKPGAGFNVDPRTLDANAVADYAKRAASQSTADFILHVIPATFPCIYRIGRSIAGAVRGYSLRICDDANGACRPARS